MTELGKITEIEGLLSEGKEAFGRTGSAALLEGLPKGGPQPDAAARREILADIEKSFAGLAGALAVSAPALDKTDINICILTSLGLPASAAGSVLALSGEAVRTRKFRMKNKLGKPEYRLFFGSERLVVLRILFMKDALQNFFRRFPAASACLAMLTLFLLYLIWRRNSMPDDTDCWVIALTLAAGVLLNVGLRLWAEDLPPTPFRRGVAIVSNLLLAGNMAVLLFLPDESFTTALTIAYASVAVALTVACLFMPFTKDKDDVPAWNFTWRALFWAGISFAVCGVLTAGLMILINSFKPLFGISPDGRVYYTVAVVTMLALPLVLFLGRMPQGDEKHADTLIVSQFLVFAVRYLLTPLMGMYLFVLYIYGLGILIRWELPDGGVAMLVTILMAGCILTETCLYPLLRSGEAKRFEKTVVRLLPALILPLLVLATVGTIRRLSDYGPTVNRMYLLVLLAWFYTVCLGLIVGGGRRIRWMATTFAALFMAVSVLPVNNSSIVRNYMKRRIEGYIAKYPAGPLPFDQDSYDNWLKSIPDDADAADIMSKSLYLRRNFRTTTYDLFGREPIYFPESRESWSPGMTIYHSDLNSEDTAIPQGAGSLRFVSAHEEKAVAAGGIVLVPFDEGADTLRVVLEKVRDENLKGAAIECTASDRVFLPKSIYIHPSRLTEGERTVTYTVTLDGILISQ